MPRQFTPTWPNYRQRGVAPRLCRPRAAGRRASPCRRLCQPVAAAYPESAAAEALRHCRWMLHWPPAEAEVRRARTVPAAAATLEPTYRSGHDPRRVGANKPILYRCRSARQEQLVQRFGTARQAHCHHLMGRLPSSVQVDDLVQNGMLGLLDAIDRFETGHGAASSKPMPASGCAAPCSTACAKTTGCRAVCAAKCGGRGGDPPARAGKRSGAERKELSEALGMPLADYQKMLHDARGISWSITRTWPATETRIFSSAISPTTEADRPDA